MPRTQQDIKKQILDQLAIDSRVDTSKVKVDVNTSKIRLTGEVPSYAAYLAAENTTWQLAGNKIIENKLKVKYPAQYQVPSDKELKATIRSLLMWNPNIEITDVDIKVENGTVILKGSVNAYWKKTRAQEVVVNIPGVFKVINNIAVVPTDNIADQMVAENIVAALERSVKVDAKNINIKVKNGVATITGTVPTWYARNAIKDIASYTAGVTIVEDNMEVIET